MNTLDVSVVEKMSFLIDENCDLRALGDIKDYCNEELLVQCIREKTLKNQLGDTVFGQLTELARELNRKPVSGFFAMHDKTLIQVTSGTSVPTAIAFPHRYKTLYEECERVLEISGLLRALKASDICRLHLYSSLLASYLLVACARAKPRANPGGVCMLTKTPSLQAVALVSLCIKHSPLMHDSTIRPDTWDILALCKQGGMLLGSISQMSNISLLVNVVCSASLDCRELHPTCFDMLVAMYCQVPHTGEINRKLNWVNTAEYPSRPILTLYSKTTCLFTVS